MVAELFQQRTPQELLRLPKFLSFQVALLNYSGIHLKIRVPRAFEVQRDPSRCCNPLILILMAEILRLPFLLGEV